MKRFWQTSSLFGLKTWGAERIDRIHGYMAGQIEIQDSVCYLHVWPRKLEQKYDGSYRIGPDQGFKLDETNKITYRSELPSDREEPNTVIEHEESRNNRTTSKILHPVSTEGDLELTKDSNLALERCDAAKIPFKRDLRSIPRYRINDTKQHLSIRLNEQAKFVSFIRQSRHAYIVSDWGLGKDEFISCVLKTLGCDDVSSNVFHVRCEEVSNVDDVFDAVINNLGISLQDLCALCDQIEYSVLIFDEMPDELIGENDNLDHGQSFRHIVNAILDFCPTIQIVVVTRGIPSNCKNYVELKRLDLPDTKAFLESHEDADSSMTTQEAIEHIFSLSDGLPMHIERIIDELRVTSLSDVISSAMNLDMGKMKGAEPVPIALRKAVKGLAVSEDRYMRRSYKLLKVLSVLSSGETIESIKRFYHDEPFFPATAEELIKRSLLEVSLVIQIADGAIAEGGGGRCSIMYSPKILRVPRQVRDYICSIISEEEYSDIMLQAATLLYGPKWREGQVRRKRAGFSEAFQRALGGPGNEHNVARHLLWRALREKNEQSIVQALRICISYAEKLIDMDRFKDASTATEEIIELIRSEDYTEEKASLLSIRGKALRMITRDEEAIEILLQAIEAGEGKMPNQEKASIYLNLAMAYYRIGEKKKGDEAARKSIKLSEKGSRINMQAEVELFQRGKRNETRRGKLVELERRARRKKYYTVANNTAITIALESKNSKEVVKMYDRVIKTRKDYYNRVRAVVSKANYLIGEGKISGLGYTDKRLLEESYTYLYTQMLVSIFSRCHEAIWEIAKEEKNIDHLLRIFRHSSFIWRICDKEDEEDKYLTDMKEEMNTIVEANGDDRLKSDLEYFRLRNARRGS